MLRQLFFIMSVIFVSSSVFAEATKFGDVLWSCDGIEDSPMVIKTTDGDMVLRIGGLTEKIEKTSSNDKYDGIDAVLFSSKTMTLKIFNESEMKKPGLSWLGRLNGQYWVVKKRDGRAICRNVEAEAKADAKAKEIPSPEDKPRKGKSGLN